MTPVGLPLWFRLPLAATAVGLAWWAFGRGRGERRPVRRWAFWATAFWAGWVCVSGEGALWFLLRGAGAWLPVAVVGVAGLFPAVRGSWRGRALGARRRWLAAAVGLMLLGPPLALLDAVTESDRRARALAEPLMPGAPAWCQGLIFDAGLRGLLVGAACAAVAAAARSGERDAGWVGGGDPHDGAVGSGGRG